MKKKGRQQQLDLLRTREAQGMLTEAERAELDALFAALDAEEMEAMRPATERMRQEEAELRKEKEQLVSKAAQLERAVRLNPQRRHRSMTLTLDVTPELHSRLREEAARQGLPATDYARMLLEERLFMGLPVLSRDAATPRERQRRLSEWIESNRGLPNLPEEAFHRAGYYGNRG